MSLADQIPSLVPLDFLTLAVAERPATCVSRTTGPTDLDDLSCDRAGQADPVSRGDRGALPLFRKGTTAMLGASQPKHSSSFPRNPSPTPQREHKHTSNGPSSADSRRALRPLPALGTARDSSGYQRHRLWYLPRQPEAAMSQVAKLVSNGRSQAVRLPAAYRFDTKEVFIRQDPETGDVILSRKPADWDGFFAALRATDVPLDFLDKNERSQPDQHRDPCSGWGE